MAGTGQSTPREDEMLREWRKPWVFARVLLIGICVSILNYLLAYYTDFAYHGLIMVGSFVMPMATLMVYCGRGDLAGDLHRVFSIGAPQR